MLGIGLALRQRGRFSPKTLFARGEAGAWYDPADLGSMFQDNAGSVAASLDAPVGRISDKSGRGNHAVQAVAAARPMLRRDGAGKLYLEFDGLDDCLRSPVFAIAQPWDRISAIHQMSSSVTPGPRRLFSGSSVNSANAYQQTTGPSVTVVSGGAGINLVFNTGVNAVLTERHNGADSRAALNGGPYVAGDVGNVAADGISIAEIGSSAGLVRAGHIRLYGVCMIGRALSDAETQRLRRFMAAKAGVVIS